MSVPEYISAIKSLLYRVEDKEVLTDILTYLQSLSVDKNSDKLQLSTAQKNAIDEGLISADRDGTDDHETVMQRMKQKFPEFF